MILDILGPVHCEGALISAFAVPLSKVLTLKPGVGQNIAMDASPAARNVFLFNLYLPGPFKHAYACNLINCLAPFESLQRSLFGKIACVEDILLLSAVNKSNASIEIHDCLLIIY